MPEPNKESSPMQESPNGSAARRTSRRRSSLTDEAPPEYLCPITCELMSDPVMIVTGQTYERSSIRQWISQGQRTCPVTRLPLSNIDLVPNYALRNAIRTWAARRGLTLPDPESAPPPRPSGATYRASNVQTSNVPLSSGNNLLWDASLPEINSPALQAVVQMYKGSSEDKDAAALQLCTIANEGLEHGRYTVVQAGAVPPLVVALSVGSDYCKETSARCFRFLCRSNNPVISQSCTAAIPGLITLLSQGSRGAKESACGALVNLSAKTDVNKYNIAAAGGVNPLVALLAAQAPQVVTGMTHECAAAVLCNLAFNNENRTEIAEKAAIPLLVKVIQNAPTPDAGEYAIHALGSLACEVATNASKIIEAGALPILINTLAHGNQWAREAAARTIRNLSFFESLRGAVVDAGAVPALTTITQHGSARSAESARAALNNLSSHRPQTIPRGTATQQETASGMQADDTRPVPAVLPPPDGPLALANAEGPRPQPRATVASRLRSAASRVHPENQVPTLSAAGSRSGDSPSAQPPTTHTRRMTVRSAYRPRLPDSSRS